MRLRAATTDDAEGLTALAARIPGAPHWPVQAFRDLAGRDDSLLLVLVDGAALRGYAAASLVPPVPHDAELEAIAVDPVLHRQGYGRHLLLAVQQWVIARGAAALYLEVRASSRAAQALYASCGFCATGRRRAYYHSPVDDAVLMQWTGCASVAGKDASFR